MSTDLKPTATPPIVIDNKFPDYLKAETKKEGLEDIARQLRPPFLKIVERMTDNTIKEKFGEGAVYTNHGELVCKKGEFFLATPIFMFAEYRQTNKKGVDPFIIERTTDETSQLAAKCNNAKYWTEYIEGKEVKNSKVFQYLIMIHKPDMSGHLIDVPVSVSFLRGRYKDGENFGSAITMRRQAMFANVFEIHPTMINRGGYDYYTFQARNPSKISQWVKDPERFQEYREMHAQLKALYEASKLQVDIDSDVNYQQDDNSSTPI